MLANPLLDGRGLANVTCDIDVLRSDGSTSIHQVDTPCFNGTITGSPNQMFMSFATLEFTGERSDPIGRWVVRVALKDNVRHVEVPLMTSFELVQ